jgi:hypothetical protein
MYTVQRERALRTILERKREEVAGEWRSGGYIARMVAKSSSTCIVFIENPEGRRS